MNQEQEVKSPKTQNPPSAVINPLEKFDDKMPDTITKVDPAVYLQPVSMD